MNNRDKTHCKSGHPFDEANTKWRITKRGTRRRQCRECDRIGCMTYYQSKVRPRLEAQKGTQ